MRWNANEPCLCGVRVSRPGCREPSWCSQPRNRPNVAGILRKFGAVGVRTRDPPDSYCRSVLEWEDYEVPELDAMNEGPQLPSPVDKGVRRQRQDRSSPAVAEDFPGN
jgi:hypothetical protein